MGGTPRGSEGPAERFEPYRHALIDFLQTRPSIADASKLITSIARALCDGPPPQRKMDERIARALVWLRGREPRGITLEEVAREAFLSSSRFAHLFTAEVGLPPSIMIGSAELYESPAPFGVGAEGDGSPAASWG